jgi:hypothetical protein
MAYQDWDDNKSTAVRYLSEASNLAGRWGCLLCVHYTTVLSINLVHFCFLSPDPFYPIRHRIRSPAGPFSSLSLGQYAIDFLSNAAERASGSFPFQPCSSRYPSPMDLHRC